MAAGRSSHVPCGKKPTAQPPNNSEASKIDATKIGKRSSHTAPKNTNPLSPSHSNRYAHPTSPNLCPILHSHTALCTLLMMAPGKDHSMIPKEGDDSSPIRKTPVPISNRVHAKFRALVHSMHSFVPFRNVTLSDHHSASGGGSARVATGTRCRSWSSMTKFLHFRPVYREMMESDAPTSNPHSRRHGRGGIPLETCPNRLSPGPPRGGLWHGT